MKGPVLSLDQAWTDRKAWQETFDRLLKFASEGPFEKEIVKAKEIFFAKLGRAHEVQEDLYEIASHSFLEWYLFNYVTRPFHKTPAVVYVTLGLDSEVFTSIIDSSLFNHWSLFEVLEFNKTNLLLHDLLFDQKRRLFYSPELPEYKVWKIKVGQIIQARLFPYSNGVDHFLTHLWLHPTSEIDLLRRLGKKRSKLWVRHQDLLISSFETVVRSFGIESQLAVSQATNWNYRELLKKYA